MKYWEVVADNLHDAGRSLGWVSGSMWKGVRLGLWTRMATKSVSSCADEKLTAFIELERAIYEFAVDLIS